MHTVKLEIADSVYSHIMFFLKNLNSKELRIIEGDENFQKLHTSDKAETQLFSDHSASLVEEWRDPMEDEVWK